MKKCNHDPFYSPDGLTVCKLCHDYLGPCQRQERKVSTTGIYSAFQAIRDYRDPHGINIRQSNTLMYEKELYEV